jgi:hypothetical protein
LNSDKPNTRTKTANKPHRHRIVENDTLCKLAQTYFGDRSRYIDIFRANTEVLSDPRLLPIGVEITIPGRQTGNAVDQEPKVEDKHAPSHQTIEDDMVPVPSYALPPRGTDHESPLHTGCLDQPRFGA